MKISVSSYSFSRQRPDQDPAEFIAMAKELGFAAIEYVDSDVKNPQRLREESERLGLPVVCYCVGADFLQNSPRYEFDRLRKQVDIAEALGCKMMRHDASEGYDGPEARRNSFERALPVLAEGCRMVTEYAAERGVATMVENHGQFCQDSGRVASLIGAVNHPNFGALADIGNFVCADEDPARAVGILAPMARHVHIKDFHCKPGAGDDPGEGWFRSRGGNFLRGAIVGHGNIPVRQCVDTLGRAGYDGYASIEFEGMEDCVQALRIGKENLEKMITRA